MVFETRRLIIRRAVDSETDVDLFYHLWTDPRVMTFVGFPHGLKITREEIRAGIIKQGHSEFEGKLVAELKDSGRLIGECKLGRPDDGGLSETDIKLIPEFWGQGYGTEIKQGLIDYLFTHTRCRIVQATPNKANIASRKMQEAVGGRRVGEGLFRFPEGRRRDYTRDVPHYIYHVFREDWERERRDKE